MTVAKVSAFAAPAAVWSAWGDSITKSTGASDPYFAWPARLSRMMGVNVLQGGIGGQTSTPIAQRQGGRGTTLTLSGNTLSAGSNTVTAINGQAVTGYVTPPQPPTTPAGFPWPGNQLLSTGDNTSRSVTGTLLGRTGTLTRTASGNPAGTVETYTFTPASSVGLPVAMPADTPFILDQGGYDYGAQLLCFGRNNYWDVSAVLADYALAVANLKGDRRYLILPPPNGAGEGNPSGVFSAMTTLWTALQAAYPDNYFDWLTPLWNGGSTVDAIYRADSLHWNDAGCELAAYTLLAEIRRRGWHRPI